MTVSEAIDVNTIADFLLGPRERWSNPVPTTAEVLAALAHLVGHAGKTLHAGWRPEEVRARKRLRRGLSKGETQ